MELEKRNYTFELSDEFLSESEIQVFNDFILHEKLDNNIWDIFKSLFLSSVRGTNPLLLRVYSNSNLCGAVVLIKCSQYGKALFKNNILAKTMDLIGIPFYLWIKFGCCMDMMSNPGFVKNVDEKEEIYAAVAGFLKSKSILTIINDYSYNSRIYPNASILPALPHAIIELSDYNTTLDYLKEHKNIKRKLNGFRNKGGSFEVVRLKLNQQEIGHLKNCFLSTAERSVFYLPYQDLYLNSAINTSQTEMNEVYYFIAKMNGEFLGYQAAIKTGNHLNTLHGAFDRTRKSNYHAYDLLFVQMVEFAIDQNLNTIDYGAVVSVTKQRMVNRTVEMSYYLLSKYKIVQWVFNYFLKITKVQGKEQMVFR
jgi:hypothetical protein